MASASDGKTMMAIRIDRESLAAFDALAEGRGGRSALLRSLLDQAMRQTSTAPRVAPSREPASNRITISLTDAELAVLDVRAAQRGVSRAGWIKALARRHIGLKGHVDDGLRDALAPIRTQLQRIGRNLNQAMKAANAAMNGPTDIRIERELRHIIEMRTEIGEQISGLSEALRGDLSFWMVAE
jgi:metal-responsive CopG/Arc/MetJ family transcriptional regulator